MNKYISFLAILLIGLPSLLNSQTVPSSAQLDQDYLDSLPEEVRNEVLQEIQNSQDDDETAPKRPSSQIAKLETVKEWEKFKLENQIKSDRYGMNLFKSMQSTFMPVNEPNFDSNYILDFGDVLTLQLTGNINEIAKLDIKRDGSISINQIGKVQLSGLSLNSASDLIKSKVKSSFIGTEAFISLEEIRDIQVFITGGVNFPGIYTLNGNSHLLHALNVSGGISEEGSFRMIEIKRDGKTINNIDLYKALILGDTSFNISLQSGDTIYVNPAKKLVRVSGALNNTGVFELKADETFDDLINFAGGFSRLAKDNKKLVLNRLVDGEYKSSNISISDFKNLDVINGDSIYASKYIIGSIEINGEVKNPGKYSITNTDTISSVIKRAGGYTENAYVYGSSIFKDKQKEKEEILNKELYSNFIKMIAYGGNTLDPMTLSTILQELKSIEFYGRAVAEFDLQVIYEDPSKDTLIDKGDVINIPKFNNNVLIYGQVNKPSSVPYVSGRSVEDYISSAGGFNNLSDKDKIIVIKPNGELKTDSKGFFMISAKDADIYPGSLIYIPNQISYTDNRIEFLGSVAPIFSSLALSIASLNSLN
tara:strand:- start:6159 stop:7934 length:1776 start_codon:yes stop_codon:yes gene_type:complete